MWIKACKAKISNAAVTKADVEYEGSLGVDQALLDAAGIYPYEMVLVVNVPQGHRFETYVIPEKRGSGAIALYGGAARLGRIGEKLIIMSYGYFDPAVEKVPKPKVVILQEGNKMAAR